MSCLDNIPAYTLSFTPADLSGWEVVSFKIQPSRLTPIARRQNYWSGKVILDGRYPALVWDYEFTVTRVTSSPIHLVGTFLTLAQSPHINSDPRPLILRGSGQDLIAFGNCYAEDSSLSQPNDFLLSSAGMFTLKFSGTSCPSIVSTL